MRRTGQAWAFLAAMILAASSGACKKSPPAEAPAEQADEGVEPASEEEPPAPAEAATAPADPRKAPPAAAPAPAPAATPGPTTPEGVPAAVARGGAPTPAVQDGTVPPPAASPRPALPDPRLLLTLKDVQDLTGGKVPFRRSALPGVPPDEDSDAILYEPERGTAYGAALQIFRGRTADAARERFSAMLASYPSAQEVQPVVGKTFFAYWEEVLYVGFLVPTRNLVLVLSCGRKHCDSEGLYELARRVGARTSG